MEPLQTFAPEGFALYERHWREIAVDKEQIPLAIDRDKYLELENGGSLRILTVRDDGRLVGYFIGFINTHPRYSSSGKMGFTDVYYLLPEYREGAIGMRLMVEAENMFRANGCVKAYLSCKVHTDLTDLFEYLGWKLTDKAFTKLL